VTRRIETAPSFDRDLKRLGRRYRGIRQDLEPILAQLIAGELPGDRLQGVQAVVCKVHPQQRRRARQKRRRSRHLLSPD
jgi:mRNA-degrading endonuclease RelE of RelBE toxin-antitoxin system